MKNVKTNISNTALNLLTSCVARIKNKQVRNAALALFAMICMNACKPDPIINEIHVPVTINTPGGTVVIETTNSYDSIISIIDTLLNYIEITNIDTIYNMDTIRSPLDTSANVYIRQLAKIRKKLDLNRDSLLRNINICKAAYASYSSMVMWNSVYGFARDDHALGDTQEDSLRTYYYFLTQYSDRGIVSSLENVVMAGQCIRNYISAYKHRMQLFEEARQALANFVNSYGNSSSNAPANTGAPKNPQRTNSKRTLSLKEIQRVCGVIHKKIIRESRE